MAKLPKAPQSNKSPKLVRKRPSRPRTARILTNAELAGLLAVRGADAPDPLNKAFRRAARKAFLWPDEAADLLHSGQSLTELAGVGPYIAKELKKWIENPPVLEPDPPIRTGFRTLTQAQEILGGNPQWLPRVNGDLQMHSVWSDGEGTILEMADAGIERGYEFISITDHSKGLKIAGGIDEARLREQGREIEYVNDALKVRGEKLRVLRSIEVNLSPRGEVDMDSDALGELDIVLGCFHSSLRKTDDQTDRYLAALQNPAIQVLGHPRGRIYNYRMGLSADWTRVFDLAAELDKAVEIDGYPDRQDLSPDLLEVARKSGCRISLGTDSHGPSQLRFMAFSAASALAAKIPAARILNFMNRDELLLWVESVRETST
jgi:histidinol phosphatase-like PHP family hydrolase